MESWELGWAVDPNVDVANMESVDRIHVKVS